VPVFPAFKEERVNRHSLWIFAGVLVFAAGCGRLFGDRVPLATVPEGIRRVTFEIVARENRCEPSVLAADREGRAVLIMFQVTSVGKQHVFLIPDLGVRKRIPAGEQVSIPVLAERSGIFQYGCTGSTFLGTLGPLDSRAKLAIK